MKITEIRIKNFGKLHNVNIRPLPGLNVIYGENETGKSTLQQFIAGMLFGPGKQRQANPQYAPWDGNAPYAGEIGFESGGEEYAIERDFSGKDAALRLKKGDGEPVPATQEQLDEIFGGMEKETYENTFCIRQASIETKKEFAGTLKNYFVSVAYGEAGKPDLIGAQERLKAGRDNAKQRYQEKLAERKEEEERLLMKEKLLEKDAEQIRKQKSEGIPSLLRKKVETELPERDTNQMAEYLRDIRQQKEYTEYRVKRGVFLAISAAALVLFVWNAVAHQLFTNPTVGWVVLEIVLALWLAFGIVGVNVWNREARQLRQLRAEQEEEREAMKRFATIEKERHKLRERQDKQARQEALEEMLGAQLLEKQAELTNLREELEECRQPAEEEQEAERQVKAYELAYDELGRLSDDICKDTGQAFSREISQIFSELTNGKYQKVGLDEKMELVAWEGNRRLHPWQLSRGTMEQIYLALRLGAGEAFSEKEPMPIILDEVFTSFDEKRLEAALQWLGKRQGQIFLFTCRKREMEMLERSGIAYGKIMLSK